MSNPLVQLHDNVKYSADVVSMLTMAGTLAQILPGIAALFTIVWTAIRIYETRTVQGIIARLRGKPATDPAPDQAE